VVLDTSVHAELVARGLNHGTVVENLIPLVIHRLELRRSGVIVDISGVVVEDLEVSRKWRVSSNVTPSLSLHLSFDAHEDFLNLGHPFVNSRLREIRVEEVLVRSSEKVIKLFHELVIVDAASRRRHSHVETASHSEETEHRSSLLESLSVNDAVRKSTFFVMA
jgi:hypothetical protein